MKKTEIRVPDGSPLTAHCFSPPSPREALRSDEVLPDEAKNEGRWKTVWSKQQVSSEIRMRSYSATSGNKRGSCFLEWAECMKNKKRRSTETYLSPQLLLLHCNDWRLGTGGHTFLWFLKSRRVPHISTYKADNIFYQSVNSKGSWEIKIRLDEWVGGRV